jgi:hypothetical protein
LRSKDLATSDGLAVMLRWRFVAGLVPTQGHFLLLSFLDLEELLIHSLVVFFVLRKNHKLQFFPFCLLFICELRLDFWLRVFGQQKRDVLRQTFILLSLND